jgi:hypothetical protein
MKAVLHVSKTEKNCHVKKRKDHNNPKEIKKRNFCACVRCMLISNVGFIKKILSLDKCLQQGQNGTAGSLNN